MLWVALAGLLFLVPLLRIFWTPLQFVSLRLPLQPARLLANWEYVVYPFRQYLILPVLIVIGVRTTIVASAPLTSLTCLTGLVIVALVTRHHKILTDLRLAEFIRNHPRIDARDFMTRYRHELAFGRADLEAPPYFPSVLPSHADFRRGLRPVRKRGPLLAMLFDTAYFAYICLNALDRLGPRYVVGLVDVVGSLWGKQTLARFAAALTVTGTEKLADKSGKFLFIFNHKSSLDFMLGFFALSAVTINGRGVRLRYIVAKDHFHDNPIVYRLLGVGRLIEAIDMIFIERKDRAKGFENLRQAAASLVAKDVDLAIYPQGTRADVTTDRALKRRDAGYYTTITKKDLISRLGHLRKGTAHLIIDTLTELSKQPNSPELHLVFMGIKGTAVTLPTNSITVQTENEMEFTVGDVVSLKPDLLSQFIPSEVGVEEKQAGHERLVQKLNELIHDRLKAVLRVHEVIAQRFLADLAGYFRYDEDKIELIANELAETEKGGDTAFQIIDRIYSLPINQWNGYLSHLSQLLIDKTDDARLEKLLREVSEKLLKK